MKLEELQNYCIKLTNHVSRYYYSATPIIDRNEISYEEVKVGTEFTSNCITLSEIIKNENEFVGVRFGYQDDEGNYVQKDATIAEPAKIKIVTGNPEKYFVEEMTFEIVPKDEAIITGGEKTIQELQ